MSSHDDEFAGTPEAELADRLERERPVPAPAFRGDLLRRLTTRERRSPIAARWQPVAALCSVAGALCLAVAALGLIGSGPFAA